MERDEDASLLKLVKDCYRRARDHSSEWRKEAEDDYDFVAGEQWSDEDKAYLNQQLRPVITFNRVAPICEAVSGSEINNRQEVRYIPRELGDVGINDLLTGTAMWVRDQCDAEDEESDAFLDLVICGMGWTETRLDYDTDPDGMVVIERTDPLEMYWDPAAKKRNLSDARWVMRIKDLLSDEFRSMWPYADISQNPNWLETQGEFRDPHDATEAHKYVNDQSGRGHETKRVYRVVEYQWWTFETYYRAMNPATGQIEKIPLSKFDKIKARLEAFGIPFVQQRRKKYYRAFLCGDQILEIGPNPCDHDFTFKCMTGKRDRNRNLWHGVVRPMKDPQRWANKFFSQILHIINSNAKGGLLAEETAFISPRQAEQDWAKPDSIIMMQDGAISQGKVKERPMGQYPVGIDRMMEFAISSMRDVTGVNLELLGMANREQAGVLENTRKQAGLTILANLFNSLKRYRKEQGRVLLYFIREYISDGRLVRINGPEHQQYVPLVRMDDTYTYDIIVDDSPTSPNRKEQVWGVLAQMLPMIMQMGLPTPPEILEYLPIPGSLAEKWKEMLKKSMEPGPEQELARKQLEAQVAELAAKAQKTSAEAQRTQVDIRKVSAETAESRSRAYKNYIDADSEEGGNNGQAEMAKMQAELQLKQAEFELKKAEMAMKLQMEKQKMLLDAQSTQQKMELDRAATQQKISLDAQKMYGQMSLEHEKTQRGLELQEQTSQQDMALRARDSDRNFALQARQTDAKDSLERERMSVEDKRSRDSEKLRSKTAQTIAKVKGSKESNKKTDKDK